MNQIDVVAGVGVAGGFFLGILLHEVAHHRLADARGDKTGRLHGRLTLSPQAHMDPVGSIIVPLIFVATAVFAAPVYTPLFGWGKRHALSSRSMRSTPQTTVLVALAGPAATLVVAVLAGVVFRATSGHVATVALFVAVVNCYLTVIDLLPIPGRDGGRVLARFLSPQGAMKMEELVQYEILFLFVLVAFLGRVVNGMVEPLIDAVLG